MGNGQNTSSWKDLWLEFGLLKDRYEILFLTHNVGIGYMECGYRGGIGERSFFNGKDNYFMRLVNWWRKMCLDRITARFDIFLLDPVVLLVLIIWKREKI